MYHVGSSYYELCKVVAIRGRQGPTSTATYTYLIGKAIDWPAVTALGDGLAGPRTKVPEIWRFDAMQ
jgi:hypothetical protein